MMRNFLLATFCIILCSCQSLDRTAVNFYLEESKSYSAEISRDIIIKNEDKIINNIPIKKVGVPDDISSLTKFLASDKANYITGQTFHVNGGMLM